MGTSEGAAHFCSSSERCMLRTVRQIRNMIIPYVDGSNISKIKGIITRLLFSVWKGFFCGYRSMLKCLQDPELRRLVAALPQTVFSRVARLTL